MGAAFNESWPGRLPPLQPEIEPAPVPRRIVKLVVYRTPGKSRPYPFWVRLEADRMKLWAHEVPARNGGAGTTTFVSPYQRCGPSSFTWFA
jgi:hypothetical protein